MKKSSSILSLLLVLIATALWFTGSWWYYTCKIKNTCGNKPQAAVEKPEESIKAATVTPKTVMVIDTDGDGLSDKEEELLKTDPLLVDTDRDSIPDNQEVGSDPSKPLDTDQDGIIDVLDPDDDNDGLSTLIEEKIGSSALLADTDEDGILDAEEVGNDPNNPLDTDEDGIINVLDTDDDDDGLETSDEILLGTNFLLADTDGDGLSDLKEIGEALDKPLDKDADGTIDALDTEDSVDQDNDGLTDALEAKLNTDPTKADTDGDGIDDLKEVGPNTDSPLDTDLDGIIDALDTSNDTDTDNDGLSDEQEKKLASNANKVDSDDDGINDIEEVGSSIDDPLDTDEDGILNINDEDDDNDGLTTRYESRIGTNPLKADTDNDGINDSEELDKAGSDVLWDTDNDGKINPVDADDDNDSLPTSLELALGTNPLKADSDDDGISDDKEVGADTKNPLDSDNDGIIDAIDTTNNKQEEKMASSEPEVSNEDKKTKEKAETTNDDDKLSIEAISLASAKSFKPSRLYFPFGNAKPELTKEASEYFSSIVKWMKQNPNNIISLTGHTDNIGKKSANLAMGIRRVMVIREMLIELGAPFEQIEVMSRGESQPIESNKTKEGRLKNRRVEIAPFNTNR